MEIGKLIYPGFNRSFEELSSIKETEIFTDKEISNINNKIKKD